MSPGEIDALWNLADRTLAKHMQDPDYIPLSERSDWLREAYKRRPIDRLPEDVTKAFDRLARCERERDRLANRIIKLEIAASSMRTRLWIVTVAATVEFAVIGWLMLALLRRLH